MAEPLYEYVVPQPSMGKLGDLIQSDVLNGKLIDMTTYDPNTGVIRWSQANARTAERIARREFERYGGVIFAETNIPAIQQLVALVALDPCGTFSAMFSDDQWNWGQWAAFCYLVAAQSTEAYTQLIGYIVGGYCDKWQGAAQQDTILYDPLGNDSYSIRLDPWYQVPYVYQLTDSWPYVFESPPAGYDGPYAVPAYALPPGEPMIPPEPGDLPPGETPPGDLPPGETPPGGDLPDLPPGEQPPAVDPVVVEEAKGKTSDTAIVVGTLAGIAAVGVLGWALTRRKANPVGASQDEQKRAWDLLSKQLKKVGLPTSKHTYRTNVDPDEFMFMGIKPPYFMFKHRGTRNYLGIDGKSGKLVTFSSSEPFFRGHYDES